MSFGCRFPSSQSVRESLDDLGVNSRPPNPLLFTAFPFDLPQLSHLLGDLISIY